MGIRRRREAGNIKWSRIGLIVLLLWSFTMPAVGSAKQAPAGSWSRGTIQMIAVGEYHSLALKADGSVVAWGYNDQGQTSVPVEAQSGVVSIAAGEYHSLALKTDGSVVAWGWNVYGQTNVPVEAQSGVVSVAAGRYHSLALKTDGSVVAWGYNGAGQTSVPADAQSGVVSIAAGGYVSLALKADGSVVAWGNNGYGQTTVPAGLSSPVKGKAIGAGVEHSLALKSDGTVMVWGNNYYGQTDVPTGLSDVVGIASGGNHSLALKSDGTVVAWGYNNYGQTDVPTGLSDVVGIAAGVFHSLALKSDGTVVVWGDNSDGQATVPTGLSGVVAIAAGGNHSLALKSDGTVVAWGLNNAGQATVPTGLSGVVGIAAGGRHSLALKSDGTVVAWGSNDQGQTGVPTELSGVVGIAAGGLHSLALKADGTVVAWGYNSSGQTTVPGSADLSGLVIDAGALSPSTFDPSVTSYTYQYVGPSVTSVDVTATLASAYAALFVDGQAQASGTAAAVSLTGASTTLSVQTEPYLLTGKTYTVTVLQDATAPTVDFGTSGSETWATSASTTVTVTDSESGVNASTLQYAWTTDTAEPASGWTSFTSGDTLTKSGADGDWYLHTQAQDMLGNTVNAASYRFRLDNTAPTVAITMKTADGNAYPDNTWTNQNVTVNVGATDAGSGVNTLEYSLDGGATWSSYSTAIVLQSDSVYSLSFKAVDALGNVAILQRTAKISASGLKLTPTLTQADASAYTSGDWTNASSVTVSVYAEAGASGLAGITYALDGGAAQSYVNESQITLNQEGAHTITFQAVDTAGNTLSASLAVNIDNTAPTVGFGTNGSESWATSASTTVTVSDAESGVDASTLQYAWTTDTALPVSGWTPFTSGDTLTKNAVDGDWYLHIQATDVAGNTVNAASNRFRLDTSAVELSGLSLSTGALSPAFDASMLNYSTSVANGVSSLTVTPSTADASDTITVSANGGAAQTVTSGAASGSIALNVGVNTITVAVAALNGTENPYTVTVTRAARSSQPDAAPAAPAAPELITDAFDGVKLITDSSSIDSSSIEKITGPDGTVIEKVALNDKTLNQALELLKDATNPILTIVVNDTERAVQTQLPAAWIASVAKSVPNAVIEVKLNGSSFQLMVNVLDLEGLAARLDVKLQDLKVNVIMKRVDGQVKNELEQIAASHGGKLVGSAVDYKITVEANGQSVEVRDFGGTYMARTLVVKADEEDKIQTAVLYDPITGTISFIPSVHATREDGTQEMVMSAPHNSIYAIMETDGKTFADLSGHWAKADVELLASKLIVSGVTDDRFAPNADITRAEFTTLLVRALGLSVKPNAASTGFADVAANAWYAPAVEAATTAGLVSGLAPDRFAPNERITREQMAALIARALTVAGGQVDAAGAESDLARFTDRASISAWAKASVAQAAAAGIITGMTENTFAPSEYATRAQAAVMLKRFLQHVRFID